MRVPELPPGPFPVPGPRAPSVHERDALAFTTKSSVGQVAQVLTQALRDEDLRVAVALLPRQFREHATHSRSKLHACYATFFEPLRPGRD